MCAFEVGENPKVVILMKVQAVLSCGPVYYAQQIESVDKTLVTKYYHNLLKIHFLCRVLIAITLHIVSTLESVNGILQYTALEWYHLFFCFIQNGNLGLFLHIM